VEFYKKGDFMIKRDKYLNLLIQNKDNGFPKVITGIRRCGKSFLLKEIYKSYLLNQSVPEDSILIVELDDDRNIMYRDPINLGEYVRNYCKDKSRCYVFLDEIQKVFPIVNPVLTEGKHIPAKKNDEQIVTFVDVILGLAREKNIDLYVTGSNSKMLSSDIITEFRDKAVNIQLLPLSFEEFADYKDGSETDLLLEYMQFGGLPLAVLKSEEEKKSYLKNLFEMTYFKDIIEHNSLKKTSSLDELCNLISSLTGQLINSEKIANTFRSVKKEKIDSETVDKYIEYFIDSFLMREARRYDLKRRTEIGALRKYYFLDTGLRNARLNFAFPDEGQMLENIVYNELIYNGYTVNVGTFDTVEKDKNEKSVRKTNEVDFFARRGINQFYIQVSANISDAETRAREIRPYLMLKDQVRKIIVVNQNINETLDENGFVIIGAIDFLLRFIK
ncbi:MAG: ATP-binding protein, partial [Treponemataceae bacterium]|nr:ATP-binding protein [Treponemataceae bacterium]